MVPRPASPTSLLWAHQLKLEHSHLLGRIKDLEASNTSLKSKLQSLETCSGELHSDLAHMKNMTSRVKAVEKAVEEADKAVLKRVEKIEIDCEKRTSDEDKNMKSLAQAIEQLEARGKIYSEQQETLTNSHNALATRIEELEKRMRSDANSRLIRKSDAQDVKVLSRRLDAIEARRTEDCVRTRTLLDRIADLEKTNENLERKNGHFQKELSRLSNTIEGIKSVQRAVSEATTVDLSHCGSPHAQVPCSPLELRDESIYTEQRHPINGSPVQDAYYPRILRTELQPTDRLSITPTMENARQFQDKRIVSTPHREKEPESANSRRKRAAMPVPTTRQTRSQARSVMQGAKVGTRTEKISHETSVTLKRRKNSVGPKRNDSRIFPLARSVQNPAEAQANLAKSVTTAVAAAKSTIPVAGVGPVNGQMPVAISRPGTKRKRREIPQPVDMESFAAMLD